MRRAARALAALAAFALLAVLYCAPAVWDWKTRVIGLTGDTSFGLWNLWHFRHALTTGASPFWTDYQYWPYGANLILHHATLANDIIAFFLIPRVGLVGAYNLLTLLGLALAGWGLYLFARDFGEDALPAFAGGAFFAFGPATVSLLLRNGTCADYANLSPIVFVVWGLARSARSGRLMDAFFAALALTWAWSMNYYYFLFGVLLSFVFWFYRESPVSLELHSRRFPAGGKRALEFAAILALGTALLWGPRGGFGGQGSVSSILLKLVPFLVFWTMIGARLLAQWTARVKLSPAAFSLARLKPYALPPALWGLLNLPLVAASVYFMSTGDYGTAASRWRGGGNPVDPLWLLLPSHQHPLWGGLTARAAALLGEPNAVCLGLAPLAAAFWLWRKKDRDAWAGLWGAGALFSAVVTLGPWLKIAGLNLYLPMPFYAIHALPLYNNLQHGLRFNVFAVLFLSLLLARALRLLPRGLAVALAALAVVECWPGPAPSFVYEPPAILQRLRSRPDAAMLSVPTGAIFNGLSGSGAMGELSVDISWQAAFEKPVVGGYLTRVARRTYERMSADAFLGALVAAQGGAHPDPILSERKAAARWLSDRKVGYVLARDGLPAALAKALLAWPMKKIDAGDGFVLYAVKGGPGDPR